MRFTPTLGRPRTSRSRPSEPYFATTRHHGIPRWPFECGSQARSPTDGRPKGSTIEKTRAPSVRDERLPMSVSFPRCCFRSRSIIFVTSPSSRQTQTLCKVTLRLTEARDGRDCKEGRFDASIIWFRRVFQYAELTCLVRGVVERSSDWGTPACLPQLDYAKA